jgi:hypothetical protein
VADKCALCEGGGEWADDPWWTADLGDNESGVPIAEVDVAALNGRRTAGGGGAASSPEKYAVVRQLQHGPRYPATEATGGGGYEGPFSVSRNAPDDENPPPEGTSIYTVYRGMIIKGCSLIDIPDQEISVLNEGSFCIMFYFDGTYYRLVSENSPMPPTQEEYAVPIATVENGDIWQVQYGTIQLPQRYLG